ncbi:MAG: SagB/ThcOx family dehydrogenase [Anaerolineae bacterium]|nr:SagB/ThcOx family dehydrogenase [Anaerolineae bacterium]
MAEIIQLPAPQKDLDFPLMQALQERRSKRVWKDEALPLQEISNILWAACGITREGKYAAKSKRTAPSACNSQSIDVYAATKEGLFRYDEKGHQLIRVLAEDIREHIGTQKRMQSAPLGLIYVSDHSRMIMYFGKDEDKKMFFSGTHAGYVSQNVYLYCAAAKLNTVVLGLVDRDKLHSIMNLKDHEKVIFTQVVGKSIDK